MKNILVMLFLSAFLVTGASAQFAGPSRYGRVATVEQVQTAQRGQTVTLEGYVVEHLRGNYYLFRDSTGDIRVTISRHVWRDRKVTSKTPVRLIGRIDRDVRERYISVNRLEIRK